MNHDDEKNPDLQAWIEPDLEARLVAAVLGEASAFETAELERLIGENPELGIFKRRIEAVHGLVGLAARPERSPLQLAPERRAKILQTIGATSARPTGADRNTPVLLQLAAARRKRRAQWLWRYGLAACITFGGILAVTLTSSRAPKLQLQKSESVAVQLPTVTSNEEPRMAMMALPEPEAEFDAPTLAAPPPLARPQGFGGRAAFFPPAASKSVRRSAVLDYYNGSEMRRASAAARSLAANYESPPPAPSPEFSPFTLSGSYIHTDLKDVGSAVSVTTPQFLQDLGATNQPTTWSYGSSTEVAGTKGNFAAAAAEVVGSAAGVVKQDSEGEFLSLSPFEVSTSQNSAYRASSTLAGSRVRTDIREFGTAVASKAKPKNLKAYLSEVTKQKATDTFAVDLNDGFLSGSLAGGSRAAAKVGKPELAASAAAIDERLSQQKAATEPPPNPETESPQGEVSAAKEPVSTFSLHVSDVSFRLAQAALARGETPDPERIRPEEFYNAFDYGDPSPVVGEKIACRIEQSAHPLLQQRNLVRIALKVPAAGRRAGQPLHLTVLLDTSGSMEREDRVASVHGALGVLASLLGANDRVTLIGFARQPRLLAEQLPGTEAAKLPELANATPFTGGTNMEEALKLAGELARRHHDPAAQNRIVLITDGAANLGNADPAQLATMIETLRQQGIAFDACGVGTDGLDDAVLEALTRKGDGRYYILDQPEDADAGFARQLAGAFRPAAENIKVQVRFNPARVGSYRLIGFEQHRLREEDFRNDKVDAAELAADEAAVALYQVEVLPQGEGELGDVFARFRDAATGAMVERSWTMLHEPHARAFDRATPSMQLAGTAALLAESLRGGDSANLIDLGELTPAVNALRGHYANNARVQELVTMFDQLRRRTGK